VLLSTQQCRWVHNSVAGYTTVSLAGVADAAAPLTRGPEAAPVWRPGHHTRTGGDPCRVEMGQGYPQCIPRLCK